MGKGREGRIKREVERGREVGRRVGRNKERKGEMKEVERRIIPPAHTFDDLPCQCQAGGALGFQHCTFDH